MSTESIKFGDVFIYKEQQYIFLGPAPENAIYAAMILSEQFSSQVEYRSGRITSTGLSSSIIYCFVKLKTPAFIRRGAMYRPGGENICPPITPINITLVPEDLEAIKKEILTSERVPQGLVEYIKSLSS